jgi:hypothetical protein
MNWPQYTYLGLVLFSLGVVVAKHGQPARPHNAFSTMISIGLGMWLLYMGGFFGAK